MLYFGMLVRSHAQCAFSAAYHVRRAGAGGRGRAPYEKIAGYLNFLPTYAYLHSTALAHFFPMSVVSSTTFLPTGAAGGRCFPSQQCCRVCLPTYIELVRAGSHSFKVDGRWRFGHVLLPHSAK